jgi:hypothetical protein
MDVLLIAPSLAGGEGVYARLIQQAAPSGTAYAVSDDFRRGAPGATCRVAAEVGLNRLVRPLAIPDIGFRALRLRRSFDLVHVHAHPVRLTGLGTTPLVMSEGSSNAVYLGEYLGWDEARIAQRYRRARRLYRGLGVRDRLLTLDRVSRAYVFSRWAREINIRWGADPANQRAVLARAESSAQMRAAALAESAASLDDARADFAAAVRPDVRAATLSGLEDEVAAYLELGAQSVRSADARRRLLLPKDGVSVTSVTPGTARRSPSTSSIGRSAVNSK